MGLWSSPFCVYGRLGKTYHYVRVWDLGGKVNAIMRVREGGGGLYDCTHMEGRREVIATVPELESGVWLLLLFLFGIDPPCLPYRNGGLEGSIRK